MQLPVAADVDIVIVGGTVRGVAAAAAAAGAGSRALLVAPRPYLGEDLCATLRLRRPAGGLDGAPITARIFADTDEYARPMRVKRALSDALARSGVRFLLECFATDLLLDGTGAARGVVLSNRAGKQCVLAGAVIDATDRAWLARSTGAVSEPWPAGPLRFTRVVVGGQAPANGSRVAACRPLPGFARNREGEADAVELALDLAVPSGGFPDMAAAEQEARALTYRPGQLRASERLHGLCPDPLRCRAEPGAWTTWETADVGHFMLPGIEGLFVLGPSAGIPREAAETLEDAVVSERLGRRIGLEAARAAASAARAPARAAPRSTAAARPERLEIRTRLCGLRPVGDAERRIEVEVSPPRWGRWDVAIVGGGTAGSSAAVGAARAGARTLLVEYQEGLGGTATLGLITRPYHGRAAGYARGVPFPDGGSAVEEKMEWLRREAREAGADIWLGALGCGVLMEGRRVLGVELATEQGAGLVEAAVVVDATGNADLAAAAGAETRFGADPDDIALQGSGLPVRPLRCAYVNTDYLLVDESDMADVWLALTGAPMAMPEGAWDIGPLIHSRERRRIVGDHVLSYLDQIAGRTYPDTLVVSASDYDAHGYPIHPFFALFPHDEQTLRASHPAPGGTSHTPYRCFLPRGLDGLLVIGLGMSMERDASALVRMQLDMHNQGYALGRAAAMAARLGGDTRRIDVRALQRHLVETGALPPEVLSHDDSFPLGEQALRRAVEDFLRWHERREERGAACIGLAVILAHADACRPMLAAAWRSSAGAARLACAKVLGVMGETAVANDLIEALGHAGPWDAKILQGGMAEYAHLPTPLDGLILALGHCGGRRALPELIRRAESLDAGVTLSHHRAVALALERLGDPSAAPVLRQVLERPGMSGHALTALEPLHDAERDLRRRTGPLREIVLARALYRCGDSDDVGKRILTSYLSDLRGLFARHAAAVLSSEGKP